MDKANILIVGGNSKIAQVFIDKYYQDFNIYATFRSLPVNKSKYSQAYELNLENKQAVLSFIDKIKTIDFKAVLFLASTFKTDAVTNNQFLDQLSSDQQINVFSGITIARNLNYEKTGRVIFFGDVALAQPRIKKISYELSKAYLVQVIKSLAVDLADQAVVLAFNLGPIIDYNQNNQPNNFTEFNLVEVNQPILGLVNFINFIINEDNLSMTGSLIDYDGGFSLKKNLR